MVRFLFFFLLVLAFIGALFFIPTFTWALLQLSGQPPIATLPPTLHIASPQSIQDPALSSPRTLAVLAGEFPGTVSGPAIVEWWNPSTKACGIFLLNSGDFAYSQRGSWWRFVSHEGLAARWPDHRTEFLSKHPHCVEGRPRKE